MAAKIDVYQSVTDKIIELLESGTVPWRRPWSSSGGSLPVSMSSKKPYRGVNVFLLNMTAAIEGYASPWWGTYKQIQERGGQVRQGEKGTAVILWRPFETKATADEPTKTIFLLKQYTVFNADQCEGDLGIPVDETQVDNDLAPLNHCEHMIKEYLDNGGPTLRHLGDRAVYSPTADMVTLPELARFNNMEEYYCTAFHEMAHSTGHPSRLDRDLDKPCTLGDPSYAREELVAEMAAAFLAGISGIELVTLDNSAAYLQNWLTTLREDNKIIIKAAAQAQRAADLITRSGDMSV